MRTLWGTVRKPTAIIAQAIAFRASVCGSFAALATSATITRYGQMTATR